MRKLGAISAGFTLIEVMVALSIFGIVAAGVAPAFTNFIRFSNDSQLKTQGMQAAEQKLDQLRYVDPASLPNSAASPTDEIITVSSRNFNIHTVFCSQASYCVGGRTRHVVVTASYSGQEVFELETVFTTLR
ncbi:MAG: type II secretion system GspH family protein [Oligoflexia bacterium]|nr:type II secretion system GspH family protein [Oligoflexia bacterium]